MGASFCHISLRECFNQPPGMFHHQTSLHLALVMPGLALRVFGFVHDSLASTSETCRGLQGNTIWRVVDGLSLFIVKISFQQNSWRMLGPRSTASTESPRWLGLNDRWGFTPWVEAGAREIARGGLGEELVSRFGFWDPTQVETPMKAWWLCICKHTIWNQELTLTPFQFAMF